jgi:CRP-like cAMP-binding protein
LSAVNPANELLARIAATAGSRLDGLSPIALPAGMVLYEELVEQRFVYFPISGVVSFLIVMKGGLSAEVGMVGREGLVGLAPVLGGRMASDRAVVQVAGAAWRMTASDLRQCVLDDSRLAALLAQYAQAFFAQVARTAVCNRLHSTEQQFCRWILMTLDRTDGDSFDMTQQAVSNMLGSRREAVSQVAARLRAIGAIEYTRGSVRVVDRALLESVVCECYGQLNIQTARLLDAVSPEQDIPHPTNRTERTSQ